MNTEQQPAQPPAQPTPGPWRWVLNPDCKQLSLESGHGLRQTIFDIKRWGTQNAQLRFRSEHHLMENIMSFAAIIPGREHHQSWAREIDHPDARLIAASPDLLAALKAAKTELAMWVRVNSSEEMSGVDWDDYQQTAVMQQINEALKKAQP